MGRTMGDKVWLRHVAVAAGYALGYSLLRSISFAHWVPLAGFRLCALLLLPYRFWPALLVGETASLSYTSYMCAGQYGWLWGALFMVPPMGFAMPVVRWCRERRRLFPNKSSTSMNMLLACSLAVSLIWTAVNVATLSVMHVPASYPMGLGLFAGRYLLGNYVGVLTLVPIVLMAREELMATSWRRQWANIGESRLVLETVSLLLPALALLVWLAAGFTGDAKQTAQVAMFLPVAWLSLRHGWRGAAIGGTAASIAVVLTMPAMYDEGTLRAQVFIAFTVSTMLLMGGRIGILHERESKERAEARVALAMAQRNVYLGEMQLRQTSYALEQMSGSIQASYTQMLGRLRNLLPGTDERTYYRQAAVAQHQIYRLADTLYPISWREKGLIAALREGSIPRALDEAGLVYWCDFSGHGLEQVSASVHIALYRLASEAIAYACAKRNVSKINVRLRSGVLGGRRWVVLCVDSEVDYGRLSRIQWDELQPALSASGMGLGAIKDRAGIFEGKVRTRSLARGQRLSMILFDPELA